MSNIRILEARCVKIFNMWRKIYDEYDQTSSKLSGGERRVLVTIELHPGLSQNGIAARLVMEPQNLLRVIDSLEAGEYLERRPSPNDRRVKTIHLLPKGEQYVRECYEAGDRCRADALKGVSKEKLAITKTALQKIEANLLAITSEE